MIESYKEIGNIKHGAPSFISTCKAIYITIKERVEALKNRYGIELEALKQELINQEE